MNKGDRYAAQRGMRAAAALNRKYAKRLRGRHQFIYLLAPKAGKPKQENQT